MNNAEILEKAKSWFRKSIAENHISNTLKLSNPNEFNINPFLTIYLANFLTGNSSPKSIAKALIYPRVLGTSITTSFGTQIQTFTSEVLGSFASTTSGIDIEFNDYIDGRKKFCQLKAGPNTINKDDVESIAGHFSKLRNLAKTNRLKIDSNDLIVGVIYGTSQDLNGHYHRLETEYHYDVYCGEQFWYRLTGDQAIYPSLIHAIAEVAIESDFSKELETVVELLSRTEAVQSIAQ